MDIMSSGKDMGCMPMELDPSQANGKHVEPQYVVSRRATWKGGARESQKRWKDKHKLKEAGTTPKTTPTEAAARRGQHPLLKEACWAISNITAGNKEQIQEVINNGLIPPVIQLLQTGDFDIKKEAAWVISNATAAENPQQIEYLVTNGCIPPVVELLSMSDVKIMTVALEALENILKWGQKQQMEKGLQDNPVVRIIEMADGISKIEALQEDPKEEVYNKAMKILETYFPLEDDENAADATGARDVFARAKSVEQFVDFVVEKGIENIGLTFTKRQIGDSEPLVIKRVSSDSWAEKKGVEEGSCLVSLNGTEVKRLAEEEFKDMMKMRPLTLKIQVKAKDVYDTEKASEIDTAGETGSELETASELDSEAGDVDEADMEIDSTGHAQSVSQDESQHDQEDEEDSEDVQLSEDSDDGDDSQEADEDADEESDNADEGNVLPEHLPLLKGLKGKRKRMSTAEAPAKAAEDDDNEECPACKRYKTALKALLADHQALLSNYQKMLATRK